MVYRTFNQRSLLLGFKFQNISFNVGGWLIANAQILPFSKFPNIMSFQLRVVMTWLGIRNTKCCQETL